MWHKATFTCVKSPIIMAFTRQTSFAIIIIFLLHFKICSRQNLHSEVELIFASTHRHSLGCRWKKKLEKKTYLYVLISMTQKPEIFYQDFINTLEEMKHVIL